MMVTLRKYMRERDVVLVKHKKNQICLLIIYKLKKELSYKIKLINLH